MKDLWIVASYTIKEMLKKKTFLVSNLIIIALIIIGFNVPNILSAIEGEEESDKTSKVLVVDSQNIYEGMLTNLNNMELGYEFQIENSEPNYEQIKKQIEDDEIEEALVISKKVEKIKIEYNL